MGKKFEGICPHVLLAAAVLIGDDGVAQGPGDLPRCTRAAHCPCPCHRPFSMTRTTICFGKPDRLANVFPRLAVKNETDNNLVLWPRARSLDVNQTPCTAFFADRVSVVVCNILKTVSFIINSKFVFFFFLTKELFTVFGHPTLPRHRPFDCLRFVSSKTKWTFWRMPSLLATSVYYFVFPRTVLDLFLSRALLSDVSHRFFSTRFYVRMWPIYRNPS